MKTLLLISIRFYQTRLAWINGRQACRFVPRCSEYAYQAISKYGILHGGWLGVRRLLSCHPFHPGGFDPVS